MILLVRPTNFVIMGVSGLIIGYFIFRGSTKFVILVLAISLGCLVYVPMSSLLNRVVFGAKNAMTERSLIIFDVAGVSSRAKVDFFAELPEWPTGQIPPPWDCYTPAGWDPFAWGDCKEYSDLVAGRMQPIGTVPIVRWWINIIVHHPLVYIRHRMSHLAYVVRYHSRIVEALSEQAYASNSPNSDLIAELYKRYGIDTSQSFQIWKPTIRYRPFKLMPRLIFSRPLVIGALLMCFISLIWCSYKSFFDMVKVDMVTLASSSIGLGNILMLFLFSVSDAGRYLLPSVICGIVSLLRIMQLLPQICTHKR
jgi:hypothetical protein